LVSIEGRFNYINIVMPVYNEKENIGNTINEINHKIKSAHKIIIIYDFEEDNTLPPVKDLMMKQDNIFLLKNKYGRGVLNAIKTGFESVNEGAVLVMMADLSDDVSIVDEMFAKLNNGYDIVCGSRYMKGGKQIGGPILKKSMSRLAGISLHFLAGLPTRDATNSFKMYSADVLQNIEIESSGGFELGMEIVIKAHKRGYKITEVPSIWRDREAGESNFKLWAWLPKYLKWYFYAIIKRS
jgi:dolichol-phosphate mannosyltransferase